MKINPSAGYEQYKAVVQKLKREEAGAGKGASRGAAVSNTDKVVISSDAALRAELGRAASALSAEVEAMATPERLETLRQAVENGTYSVASETLADAILGYEE